MRWEDVNKNLSTRVIDSVKNQINNPDKKRSQSTHIITSSNDLGVIRNGGRNGSLYGPRAILSVLSKMAKTSIDRNIFHLETVDKEITNFDHFQAEQINSIKKITDNTNGFFIHLASGHDGIYPFIKAISANNKVVVINLDAHLDTRQDKVAHSGTPFRQLANELGKKLQLIQVGIHDFANAPSNYQDVNMEVVTMSQLKEKTSNMTDNKKFINDLLGPLKREPNLRVVISIDIDAIDGSEMKAVSAVNHDGIKTEFIRELLRTYKKDFEDCYVGLYEYNPLFDDLGMSGARSICSLIHPFFYSN